MKLAGLVLFVLFTPLLACSDNSSQKAADAGADSSADVAPADTGGDLLAPDSALDAAADSSGDPALVVTKAGPLRGAVSPQARAFLGIPFAAPPVGDLRWAPPEPVDPWTEERDATKHGPSCPQPNWNFLGLPADFDEDCLLLSVWTPNPSPTKAPVMVWFHGGGFVAGGAATPLYDGKALTSLGVVVVGVSYRLGALGFLAHPDLEAGGQNYAILDQQAALRWVQDNIAAFGGDPDNVTIFGESAGAISNCVHLASPGSNGLFHRAVLESGACVPFPTQQQYGSLASKLGDTLGCQSASDLIGCLRGKSADELVAALSIPKGMIFGEGDLAMPFIDGTVLPEQPTEILAAKKGAKVPVLLGTTANEATFFLVRTKQTDLTEQAYVDTVKAILSPPNSAEGVDLFGGIYPSLDVDAVLSAYPASEFDSPADALAELVTDAAFVCPARRMVRAIAAAGQATYLYQFAYPPSYFKLLDSFYRVAHGSELPFVFGNHPLGINLTGDEKALADQVMGYWTRFAATGDPNDDPTTWQPYETATDGHLVIDLEPTAASGLKKNKCDFWDAQI